MCLYTQNYISDNEYKCCIFINKIILNIYYVSFLLGLSMLWYSYKKLVQVWINHFNADKISSVENVRTLTSFGLSRLT